MRLKATLKFMFLLFCVIVTGQLIVFTYFLELPPDVSVILYSSLAGVAPSIIFAWTDRVSKFVYYVWLAVHFCLTTVCVFGVLGYFGRFASIHLPIIVGFFLVVYVSAHLGSEFSHKKEIDELNKRINEAYTNQE